MKFCRVRPEPLRRTAIFKGVGMGRILAFATGSGAESAGRMPVIRYF